MSADSSLEWIKATLVPRLALVVDTWKDARVVSSEVHTLGNMKDNFASQLYAASVNLEHAAAAEESHDLVVKIMVNNENVRVAMQSEKQFFNEIHMYANVLPVFSALVQEAGVLFDPTEWFPRHYYSSLGEIKDTTSEEDGIVVLENLTPKGFKLGDRRALDLDHCTLAMEQLGRFHALSYALKLKDKAAFERDLVSPVQETMYRPEMEADAAAVAEACNARVLEAYQADPSLDAVRLRDWLTQPSASRTLVTPREPLAVFCHGDFCRNNMLFRYGPDGRPCEVKFFDFQTIRYASPAIDISLFLFLNTTPELREQCWDDLLCKYHSAMSSTLAALLRCGVDELPDAFGLHSFLDDFRQHAIYGFLVTLLFLPWMIADEEEMTEVVSLWQENSVSPEYLAKSRVLGGDTVTSVLVTLAREVIKRDYAIPFVTLV